MSWSVTTPTSMTSATRSSASRSPLAGCPCTRKPASSAADDDAQSAHRVSRLAVVVGAVGAPRGGRAQRAMETAPASGVPTLRSASGRARPTLGLARPWPRPPASAASAAASTRLRDGLPARVCCSSASTNGTSASSIVLSPTLALPRVVMASSPARTAAATSAAVICRPGRRARSRRAASAAPQRTPEVPPALAAQASPAALSTVAGAVRSAACSAARGRRTCP